VLAALGTLAATSDHGDAMPARSKASRLLEDHALGTAPHGER
jgi:hypothetical protein